MPELRVKTARSQISIFIRSGRFAMRLLFHPSRPPAGKGVGGVVGWGHCMCFFKNRIFVKNWGEKSLSTQKCD